MSENIIKTGVVLEKKANSYSWEPHDFVAESELTVTITLAEYRELVSSVATKNQDIEKANKDKYSRDAENKSLKEEIERLKSIVFDLQNNHLEN